MKVLITGSNGMVGRSLTTKLKEWSHIELFTPSRNELNLLNQQDVDQYVKSHQVELVIHLAARVGGIQANIMNPVEFMRENILINMNVINAALANEVPKLLYIGSSCMYPKDRDTLSETDVLTGVLEPTNEGYAFAKISGALLCKYINQQYGLTYKTIIPSNLYGPYDNFHPVRSHLIPAIIRKLHEGKQSNEKVVIWGNGEARREFMFVDDLSDFILLAMKRMHELPQDINVGLGYDYSINEYYHAAAKVIGYQNDFVHDLDKPAGMKRKLLNIGLAKAFGWQPKISIEVGIQKTYDYFLSHIECPA